MKCPKCDGTGEMQICEMGFIGKDECDKCHGKGYLNNEEWLRSCTTEELAEFIRKQRDDWSDGWYSDCHRFDEIIEWLKQPHREEKHE